MYRSGQRCVKAIMMVLVGENPLNAGPWDILGSAVRRSVWLELGV